MKKFAFFSVIIAIVAGGMFLAAETGRASDEQGNTKPDTIFQKLGDFITGDYDINGKPIKKTGVLQPIADEINKMGSDKQIKGPSN